MGLSEEASEAEIELLPASWFMMEKMDGSQPCLCRIKASYLCSFRSFQIRSWCKSTVNFKQWQEWCMCLCILYLHFCKEIWLSVNTVVFEESGTIYPKGTSSTFEAHICWEHLWVIFPIFKSSNIGTMIIWHRIISFLELKGGTFRDYAVWALPFLWVTKLKRTSSALCFPAS